METREYFESVMQGFNQNRNGRSLRKYCIDNGVDYRWLSEYKKSYSSNNPNEELKSSSFTQLDVIDEKSKTHDDSVRTWEVSHLTLTTPSGESIEIKSNNLSAVSELLRKMSV